ncbi:odorant receptor 74a-like [Zeugodacus cucurbitae]|uniref:Odorant receptor n=1 Tax=Zeugodacus cucurbitae TaxID=28588 RepID=A0A5H2WWQ2_ZEUCU|nr:odorant receptor 74a-like [Zeugodacus cucurbitae]QKN21156.1 odorant receptor [Zeugodacus cucurbitae]
MRYLPASYHKPLLPNGRHPPIDWQIYGFICSNCWPLAAHITKARYIVDIMVTIAQFMSESMVLIGEGIVMHDNLDNISFVCTVLAPNLILIEMMLRAYNIIYRRSSFRKHIEEFYKKIYVQRTWNPDLFEQIRRQQLPTKYSTCTYIITLVTYVYVPISGLIKNERLVPFPIRFSFDYTVPWPRYLVFLAMSIWTGFAVVGPLVAEPNLLAMQILHLNGRYSLLLQDLRKISKESIVEHERLKGKDTLLVTQRFRYRLFEIIRRNVELNEFAKSLQEQYSFRVFVMMAMSATLLCVLGFLTATLGLTAQNIRFVSWIIGKVVELLIFGRLGTTLSTTTDELSTSYYCCDWEDVILHSTDAEENKKLMKLIALAVHLNSNPFRLTGLNFSVVNYETVVSILRGAGSYFTVIYAYR